ncbi:sporulation integral membrane protein YlbJ [Thalassobacillus sp. B23F22_16]|uniref:sporulation integral membrane protein YlbJ n=1 Tax=Thalassobacillus sp. B23F22_16 TaxID=3459513 RepID=UPI00373F4497
MKSQIKSFILALITILFAILLIQYPDQALSASIRGLNMWWEIVFPSLLPFFIISELMIGFGVVTFIGVLFEPIMRPLFNVPGAGSFVWAMGMASGYPSGAKITARLRQEKQLTRIEAERLVSFTNASNPLFIFGAIAVGFFNDPVLGMLLAVSHYGGNTMVGIVMRYYHRKDKSSKANHERFSIKRAFRELHETRIKDERPFGKLFGDAVLSSIQTLLMIGGFIIIFSVLNKLLFVTGVTEIIAASFTFLLTFLHLPEVLSIPIFSGLMEITMGSQMISQSGVEMLFAAVAVSFILGFNGFSVQAQVASILAETDIRFYPYFLGRLMHGLFASVLCILLFQPLYASQTEGSSGAIPVLSKIKESGWPMHVLEQLSHYGPIITIASLMAGCLILWKQRKTSHFFK